MKIGVTERGDAGINLEWVSKLNQVDGAILITKNITSVFISEVKAAVETNHPIIVHATCTGWGQTVIEPNVPSYEEQLSQLCALSEVLPKKNIVLRVDPIIPTDEGYERMQMVLDKALSLGILPEVRVRISVLDNYPHVRARFKALGLIPLYNGYFSPLSYVFKEIAVKLRPYAEQRNIKFECCAEPEFSGIPWIYMQGCVSHEDLQRMQLFYDGDTRQVGYQRKTCLCLGEIKTELLNNKYRCPNHCAYCYWKGD